MHELSITQSIVETIEDRLDGARVTVVRLEVGKLAGIVCDSLRFCFDVVAAGTTMEGARLDIDEPVGLGRCRDCGAEQEYGDLILLCDCGSADIEVLAGRELRITSVEVA
ncbi:hydrogenase maturation nickel metallochaperone HypA/HybF [Actinokineospora sp.]|uniref:hydrogenase maturation nickel metallochaperone HypA/HybF n=1 Tax=Actinokineospora sp. TaxID=1872133 RepID=UPI0040376877